MSDGHEDDLNPNTLPALQPVGYGKPPVEHRFKKGQSGNPRGRPPGSRKTKIVQYDPAHCPTSDMILNEAYRPVMVREGDQVVELPVIQAVMRAMSVSAMKGNRLAQKLVADIVQKVEAEHQSARLSLLENMQNYQDKALQELAHCEKHGLPAPEFIPHPDDIFLNYRTGSVKIEGPHTRDEKRAFDKQIARREMSQEEVSYLAEEIRNGKLGNLERHCIAELHHEQAIFDLINDVLPARYQATLKDRSYRQGASRPGDGLKRIRARAKKRGW